MKNWKYKFSATCLVLTMGLLPLGCNAIPNGGGTVTSSTKASTGGDLTASNVTSSGFVLQWPVQSDPTTGKKAAAYNIFVNKKGADKAARRLFKKVTEDNQTVTLTDAEKGQELMATVEALDDKDVSFASLDVSISAPAVVAATPTTAPTAAPTAAPTVAPTAAPAEYVQVERLARPAINEGLMINNDLLNLWNSVMPSVEADFLSGKSQAAKPIVDEATTVLKALGNTDAEVSGLFTALLPDVMRIDTTKTSGYVGSAPGLLDNVTKDLRPIGGRMIKDDVIDITMSLIVPGGAPGAAPIAGLESDNVSYDGPNANGTKHKPVMSDFPYLAAPN